jgi:hypothetical protein
MPDSEFNHSNLHLLFCWIFVDVRLFAMPIDDALSLRLVSGRCIPNLRRHCS